jgi:tetratricopeptide (TPR) repeat protein
VQAEIASRVAQALDVKLGASAKKQLAEPPTANVAAYDEFLKGEQLSQSLAVTDPRPLRRAIANYQQAVTLDPTFVQAWVQLARASCSVGNTSPTSADDEVCRHAAEQASAIDANRPESRLAMGTYLQVRQEYDKALEQFTRGLEVQPNNSALLDASALVERSLGLFDAALSHLQQAAHLDPRSIQAAHNLARTYHDKHQYKEADAEYARALALAPNNLRVVQARATNYLSQGDLPGARAVIAESLKHTSAKDVVIRFATFQEMMWVLPEDLRAQVVALQPADFDNERGMWALKVGATYLMMSDVAQARSYGRISASHYEETVKRFPDDAQRQELLGRALVLAGRPAEAIEAGKRSLALRGTLDAVNGPYYKYQVARIYIQAGQYENALDLIEPLLSLPGDVTPGWLRIDPVFAPLRGNPRFERLIKSGT